MFHHHDVDHLRGNLFHLAFFGRPVYMEFGTGGLYTTFFAGGILSALNFQSK
jgi:membrane associated rhomboid family serine protease